MVLLQVFKKLKIIGMCNHEKITILNEEVRKQTLMTLRQTNHRLDALGLLMDNLLGMIEQELPYKKDKSCRKKSTNFATYENFGLIFYFFYFIRRRNHTLF